MVGRTALAGAAIIGGLAAFGGDAVAAGSNLDCSTAGGRVATTVAIAPGRAASVPVPRDCFAGRETVTAVAPDSGQLEGAGAQVPSSRRYLRYTPAPEVRSGTVLLRFNGSNSGERRVAVEIGGADASRDVVAIGDSVTAAFGYNANDAALENGWMTLKDCNQEAEYPKLPQNSCSNNRTSGLPWQGGGERAGDVAYPMQFRAWLRDASRAAGVGSAPDVRNWAVSGARPAHWDPQPMGDDPTNRNNSAGGFSGQTAQIRDSLVVMTLGANRLLADFLNIDFAYPMAWFGDIAGDYAKCTGARGWIWGYDEAGRSRLKRCFDEDWAIQRQGEHLVSVYQQLLRQNNKVLVVGYHLACPSTFGTWQQMSFIAGPAAGGRCTAYKGDNGMSQWDQAVYVSGLLNEAVDGAVRSAQAWARTNAPGSQIAFVDTASLNDWSSHQTWSGDPWVFPNDTGIHPSRAGHAQMARNVADATCSQLGLFCAQHAALTPASYRFPGDGTRPTGFPLLASASAAGAGAGASVASGARGASSARGLRAEGAATAVKGATVVARVGTTEITAAQVRRMGRLLGDDARDPSGEGAAEALKTLITGAQVRAEARRLGIAIPNGAAATRRAADFAGRGRALAAERRFVVVSALLSHRVGARLVGTPKSPTAAEGRAYARRELGVARPTRLTIAAAREGLADDRNRTARERVQTLVDRRYRASTRCTAAARGNPACTTQHGAWTW